MPTGTAGAPAGNGGAAAAPGPGQEPSARNSRTLPTVPTDDVSTGPRDPSAGPSARGPPTGAVIGEGSFGTVYEYPGNTALVTKKLDRPKITPEQALESALGQQRGQALIDEANARLPGNDIPMTRILESDPRGNPPWMVMENLKGPAWAAKDAATLQDGPLNDEQLEAVNALAENIADKGLVWIDPNPGNMFFFREGKVLKAGVLDHEFIYTPDEFMQKLETPGSLGWGVFTFKRMESTPLQEWQTVFNDNGVVEPRALMNAVMQAHRYR